MNTRYFRASTSVYAGVCQQLDAAYGYPNAETKTERALPLASELPSDSQGQVYLAIDSAYCDFILPGQMLPDLLASGTVQEVTAEQYATAEWPV